MTQMIKLQVETVEELRDSLSTCGLFEMLDCIVNVRANADTSVEDLDRLRILIDAAINVIDITFDIDFVTEGIQITILEVPVSIAEGKDF